MYIDVPKRINRGEEGVDFVKHCQFWQCCHRTNASREDFRRESNSNDSLLTSKTLSTSCWFRIRKRWQKFFVL